MNKLDLVFQHAKLMEEAFNCTSRKDALEYIHQADKLQATINALEARDRYRYD
jgi:hypothetical protein